LDRKSLQPFWWRERTIYHSEIVKVRWKEGHVIFVSGETLKPLARKYIWWKTPDETVTLPEREIAQVGDEVVLREVLTHVETTHPYGFQSGLAPF
jgi:phage gp45-like